MNLKYSLYYLFLCATIACCNSSVIYNKREHESSNSSIKEKLNHPFGTLLKLRIQVIDGDSLDSKGLAGSFIFKVKCIDSVALPDTILMEFKDETGKFPRDIVELSEYLYGSNKGRNSYDAEREMKNKYVGKLFDVIAYESGQFTGIPDGYFKYQPIRQDVDFYFKNYLIIVADLTKNN